jgi:hypothetical protein
MKSIFAAAILLSASTARAGSGQNATAQSASQIHTSGDASATLGSFAAAIGAAKSAAKSGDLATAESALTQENIMAPGTGEWHLETANKLLELATELAREGGNNAAISPLATLVLQHLAAAAANAHTPGDRAQAKAAAAIVYVRYVGDPTSAIASYQAALALAPNDPGIKQALARLQATLARAQARTQ